MRRVIRILVAEEVPSLNKGEEEILIGILDCFKSIGPCVMSVLSFFPEVDAPRYTRWDIEVLNAPHDFLILADIRNRSLPIKLVLSGLVFMRILVFILLARLLKRRVLKVFRRPFWEAFYYSDVIVMCHDGVGIFDAEFLPLFTLYMALAAKFMKKTMLFLSSGGVLPVEYLRTHRFVFSPLVQIGLWLGKAAVKMADLIVTRDTYSYKLLRKALKGDGALYTATDTAFLARSLPKDGKSNQSLKEILDFIKSAKKPLVGITLTREALDMMNERYSSDFIAKFIDVLLDQLGASVLFIPHGYEPYLNDVMTALEIHEQVRHKHHTKVITAELEFYELRRIIGELDILITSRLHAAIDAILQGVPFIFITSSKDTRRQVIIDAGFGSWIHLIDRHSADELLSRVDNLWLVRDKVKEFVKRKRREVLEKAILTVKLIRLTLLRKKNNLDLNSYRSSPV